MKTNSLRTNVDNLKVPGRFTLPGSLTMLWMKEHGRIHKIFHVRDIENFLEIDNLEEYINNLSF